MKPKPKPPKIWIELKRKIKRRIREEIRGKNITRKYFGMKPIGKKREKRLIGFKLDDYLSSALKRKRGESKAGWRGRCEDFTSWFLGDHSNKHMRVGGWAIWEFRKRRKRTAQISKRHKNK